MLDQFHSSLWKNNCFVTKKSFDKPVKISCLKWTIATIENLQRIKYITLFKHTQLTATFRIQLNIYDIVFLQKYLTAENH